jgi:hypothetical protein
MDLTFDDLFAYRLNLQDYYSDESIIIQELKKYVQSYDSIDDVNQYIVDFYDHFGIDISLDILQEDSDDDLPDLIESPMNNVILTNIINGMNEQLNQHHIPINNNAILTNMINSMNNQLNQEHIPINFININEPQHIVLGHESMINILNQLMQPPPQMSDVVTTLADEDHKNLEKKTHDGNTDIDCTVCMAKVDSDEEITVLPCKHTFHTECIDIYLKEYNYICPVCRCDVGKNKVNF